MISLNVNVPLSFGEGLGVRPLEMVLTEEKLCSKIEGPSISPH
jgi:hypothetical protein